MADASGTLGTAVGEAPSKQRKRLLGLLRNGSRASAAERVAAALALHQGGLLQSPWHSSQVISTLGRAQLWPEALNVLAGACKVGQAGGEAADLAVFNAAASACGKAGRWQQTLAVLEQADLFSLALDVTSCNTLLSAFGVAGEWPAALRYLTRMSSDSRLPSPDVVSFCAGINACARAGCWEWALASFETLQGAGLRKDPRDVTFNALLDALGRGRRWDLAMGLLKERRAGVNVNAFTAVISACATCGGLWENALALLQDMRNQQVAWDVVAVSAAISACEKGLQWQRALWLLLEDLPRAGLAPNVVACNAALSACEKCGRWNWALQLLTDMRPKFRVFPDCVSYSAAAAACAQAAQVDYAWDFLGAMSQQGISPDASTYGAISGALAAGRSWQRALVLLTRMRGQSLQPNPAVCADILHACAQAGQEEVHELWAEALRGTLARIHAFGRGIEIAGRKNVDARKDLALAILGTELLLSENSMGGDILAASFRRMVYRPALLQLKLLCAFPVSSSGLKHLQPRVGEMAVLTAGSNEFSLDQIPGLGCFFTAKATEETLCSGACDAGVPWMAAARLSVRSCHNALTAGADLPEAQLWLGETGTTTGLVSKEISAWLTASLKPSLGAMSCSGRPCGHQADMTPPAQDAEAAATDVQVVGDAESSVSRPSSRGLLPVLAEHDRSSHAERQALMMLLWYHLPVAQINLAEFQSHMFRAQPLLSHCSERASVSSVKLIGFA
ncbi:unnamed protein product [Polarella glacialis]|uniref:Pentatricopeptide repeat-containing protein, chloroplastic n=1 Tax=Polarella glacialis TaxID=89957 RepID=A0A813HGL0_POLGL|nr:unnamed protein product [Polarella glacialis]